MPFMNFKIENVKNIKMEFKKNAKNLAYLFTKMLIISWHTDVKEALRKKIRAIKLEIQDKHMTLTSLLMFSVERKLSNNSVLSSHSWIKT